MRFFLICLVMSSVSGCSLLKSRYAMDDPVYAEKYAAGAKKFDILGKAKQALDARHAEGLGGVYLSGGAQYQARASEPFAGIELGTEGYATSWTTGRVALAATGGDGEGRVGVDLGTRLQTPTRIAPFAGVGMFLGARPHKDLVDMDGLDNDDDGWIDEYGEKEWDFDNWLVAVYPEVGTHVWLNGSWRLTAYGRYLVTTEGRVHDDWLLGGQLTVFRR
ncbi:MAG: hypothetical protein QGG71_25255 [Pirellulaceae bacterium]|jgi:hypothetical protein|nr:hypothetical protein [Pirellulaceae bacterium]